MPKLVDHEERRADIIDALLRTAAETGLHAVTMRDAVSFASAWEQFDGSGTLREPDRAERSMTTMLNRLRWWAVALRNARQETPYLRTA